MDDRDNGARKSDLFVLLMVLAGFCVILLGGVIESNKGLINQISLTITELNIIMSAVAVLSITAPILYIKNYWYRQEQNGDADSCNKTQ